MFRSLLTLLLLLNYLLVVGVGLLVSRPPVPRYSAAHPYVHSKDCQRQHYLRLDCFERCNGDQHTADRKLPASNAAHLLTLLKGLDEHCPLAGPAPTQPAPARPPCAARHPGAGHPSLPLGHAARGLRPPAGT